ncbi:MAG: hypothetical protein EOM66_03235 [Clostridia bacterium]|nr:hypothetical protein [Clostridia bacterium]
MNETKTRVIAIEGIDGSGKSVQFARLAQRCREAGMRVDTREYPVYGSYFGAEVGRYLSGSGGVRADQVDGRSMALWYALDRWENLKNYTDGEADILLINRYVLSNGVYQSIRDIDLGKPDLLDWTFELEYGHFGLPPADIFIFYDVDTEQAGENVLKKGRRVYLACEKDVYEASQGIQERARSKYLEAAARREDIMVIRCMEKGVFRTPDAIANETWETLKHRHIL